MTNSFGPDADKFDWNRGVFRVQVEFSTTFMTEKGSIPGAIEYLQRVVGRVPAEFRDKIVLKYDYDFDIEAGNFECYYERPVTPAERNMYENDERRKLEAIEARERDELVRLKAKYEAGKGEKK